LPSGLFFFVSLLIANLGGNTVTKNKIIFINNARFAPNRDIHWCLFARPFIKLKLKTIAVGSVRLMGAQSG
jgi:hypothetical protein